jgi:intracellular sulfur oxidation DsrE/DsrF family protein
MKADASCFDALDVHREALPGVEIVPSGVAEVVRLQSEGYNYVKIP